jgi:hypothetical protein
MMQTMEVHFSSEQLIQFTSIFMGILCKRVSEIPIQRYEHLSRRDYELGHMKAIIMFLERDSFLYAWLCSETLYQDLEYLYSMHLPSGQQWDKIVPHIYHELIPGSEPNKKSYNGNINLLLENIKIQQ